MFRLSSLGNEPPPFEREKNEEKKGGEKREKEEKNDRDSDYVADAPQEFVVCVFRYAPARARARACTVGPSV